MDLAKRVWRKAAQRDDLYLQIDGMLRRIRHERGSAADVLDFKTGTGGVIEAEFLVQALQMRAGIWNPQTLGALRDLTTQGLLREGDSALLEESYKYLRLIESALRRWENKSVSSLPADETEQHKLAQRVGADSLDSFGQRYREARESIHAVYSRYLGESSTR
jgi:glutamine synthetase adenylyltransferase